MNKTKNFKLSYFDTQEEKEVEQDFLFRFATPRDDIDFKYSKGLEELDPEAITRFLWKLLVDKKKIISMKVYDYNDDDEIEERDLKGWEKFGLFLQDLPWTPIKMIMVLRGETEERAQKLVEDMRKGIFETAEKTLNQKKTQS